MTMRSGPHMRVAIQKLQTGEGGSQQIKGDHAPPLPHPATLLILLKKDASERRVAGGESWPPCCPPLNSRDGIPLHTPAPQQWPARVTSPEPTEVKGRVEQMSIDLEM
mmetsp:Transcript_26986/g.55254  ORF Transcript_26986/g.55254 Transcript_26986/m.55254 type:complete len:108 (-) Transcript_26986:34-357(-)